MNTPVASVLCLLVLAEPAVERSMTVLPSRASIARAAARDGRNDFDFEIGTWRTKLSRLVRPLSGSKTWVDYEGTSVVRRVLNGRANLVELTVEGPAGRIEGLSLRLYEPEPARWTIHYANIRDRLLTPPVSGRFEHGRGEFYGPDTLDGRPILVRFVISDIKPDSCRFEQAFSADEGKTWEVNWIATDTRVSDARREM